MNARKHREYKQAEETDRLEPKGEQSGRGFSLPLDANNALPVYRANLNHPVDMTEHGNAVTPPGKNRADLTARRVRGHSIGMAEEANASGNALDKPTSAESILVREIAEPSRMEESK